MTGWEESLFALGEKGFLNLIKNYIVDLSTPYNKQDMIRKLSLWLSHEKNIRALISRINDEEKTILSVIYYLKNVPCEKLPLDWPGEAKVNLIERLLIYEDAGSYHINPLLEPALLNKGILRFSLLLDERPADSGCDSSFMPDDRLWMGFLSYFSEEKSFFLNDGSPRRRIIEELQERLPYPAHREDSFFTELAELFLTAGLLEKRKNSLILGPLEELERFESYTPEDRLMYLAILNGPSPERGKLRFLLNRLKNLLSSDKVISPMGWIRLLYFVTPHPSRQDLRQWSELPSRLSLLGLCRFSGGKIGFPPRTAENPEEVPAVLVQPNGDIDLPPETPFSTGLVLSAQLEKGETFYRFHVTRKSFESGLRRGKTCEKVVSDLENLTGRTLPGNLVTNLKEWENQLYSLRKVSGILIKAVGYPRRVIDQIPDLEKHIIETIGDEWILMREDTEKTWKALLAQVELNPFEEHRPNPGNGKTDFPDGEAIGLPCEKKAKVQPDSSEAVKKEDLFDKLHTLELPEEQEKEFLNRIERGVVILPEQISPSVLRAEACKAGGLDFNAKLRLISSALESDFTRLEMKLPAKGGMRTVRAIPLELQNSRENSDLLFLNEETGEEESVAVRKILEVISFHGSLLS